MTNTWSRYGLPTVLAAALLGSSAVLADDPKVDSAVTSELKASLEKFRESLSRLESIEQRLRDTQTQNTIIVSRLQDDVLNLKRQMDQMQKDLAALSAKLNTSSISQSPPRDPLTPMPMPSATAATGRLRLMNEYLEEVTVVVNNSPYRLLPGQELTLTLPAGAFSYQVLQLQSAVQNRRLSANETLTIRVHAQGR